MFKVSRIWLLQNPRFVALQIRHFINLPVMIIVEYSRRLPGPDCVQHNARMVNHTVVVYIQYGQYNTT